jgi:hypothetical protein
LSQPPLLLAVPLARFGGGSVVVQLAALGVATRIYETGNQEDF